MQIIGFHLTHISAERKSSEMKENLRVHSTLDIKEIVEDSLEVMKDQKVLRFVFSFSTNYSEEYASVVLHGVVMVVADKSEVKDILKRWEKKEVDPKIQVPLFNVILTKCNVKSLQLEDELGLPLHVQLPRVEFQQGKSYTG